MLKAFTATRDSIRSLHAFIDTLTPPWRVAYYAVESAVMLSVATMVGNYYFCLTNDSHFNWPSQFHEFQIAVQLAVVKAVWDLFKQLGQVPVPAAPPQNGA